MKILALDMGDVWIGTAISDALRITCRPYQTVKVSELTEFLCKTIPFENITTIVYGMPYTMKGESGTQATKVVDDIKTLQTSLEKKHIQSVKWEMWDERRTSKQAQTILRSNKPKQKTKLMKNQEHSVAAALILQNYLDRVAFKAQFQEEK